MKPLQLCLYLVLFQRYYQRFLNFKDITWPWAHPFRG